MPLPLAGIISRLAGLAGRGAAASALFGGKDDGLDPHVAALSPDAQKAAGSYKNPLDPATPPTSKTRAGTQAGLDSAVESHGKEISAALARLERAIKNSMAARKGQARPTTDPATGPTGKKEDEDWNSEFWSGVAGGIGGKGSGIRGKAGRLVDKAKGLKGRIGGALGKLGTAGKIGAGGVVGSLLYMGGEYVLGGVAQGVGEAVHGKEKVAAANRLRDETSILDAFRTPDLRLPELLGGPSPAKRKNFESRIISFVASKMAFDFDQVTGISGYGTMPRGGGEDPAADDSGDHSYDQGPDGTPAPAQETDFQRHRETATFSDLTAPAGSRPLQTPKKDGEVAFDPAKPDVSKRPIEPFHPPTMGGALSSPVPGADLNDPNSVPYSGGSKNSRSFGGPRGSGKLHTGVDIPGTVGDPIVATQDGVVRRAELSDSGYGWIVDVEYPDGTVHRNAHMDGLGDGIHVGAKVKAGQSLGGVGHSGNADAGFPHNHYEVIKKDYYDQNKGRPPGRARTREELDAGRLDPREYYAHQRGGEDAPVSQVSPTSHGRNGPDMPARFFKGGLPQPQGEFVGSAAPYQPPPKPKEEVRPKSVVRRTTVADEERVERRDRKRKFDPDRVKDDGVSFADYVGVGSSEVATGE